MKRFQNILLACWGTLILLFVLFNLDLVWGEGPIEFLFMDFAFPWLLWLCGGAVVLPLLFRLFSGSEARQAAKLVRKEIAAMNAGASEKQEGDMEQLAERIHSRLESSIEAAVAARLAVPEPAMPEPEPDAEPDAKD